MRRNRVVALTVRPTYDSTAPHTLFLSVLLSLSVTEPRSTSASSRHIGSGQFREELSNWPKIPGENNERHKGRSWRGNDACSIEAEFRTLEVAAVRLEEA